MFFCTFLVITPNTQPIDLFTPHPAPPTTLQQWWRWRASIAGMTSGSVVRVSILPPSGTVLYSKFVTKVELHKDFLSTNFHPRNSRFLYYQKRQWPQSRKEDLCSIYTPQDTSSSMDESTARFGIFLWCDLYQIHSTGSKGPVALWDYDRLDSPLLFEMITSQNNAKLFQNYVVNLCRGAWKTRREISRWNPLAFLCFVIIFKENRGYL